MLNRYSLITSDNRFVIASAIFSPIGIHTTVNNPATTFDHVKLKEIAECFLFNLESTFYEFFTMISLSHHIYVDCFSSAKGTLNIHSLNRRYLISSMQCFIAMNSEENALVSNVCCCLLIHLTVTLFTNKRWPEHDRPVTLSEPCDAPTNDVVTTAMTLGLGILCGISSSASQ